jgi:hypothetical protein
MGHLQLRNEGVMAGFSRVYMVGGLGGFDGSDGVNPIEFMILVGNADRQWFEPHYVDLTLKPIGHLRSLVPRRPDDANALLDACMAFAPRYFESCPSLAEVTGALLHAERLDFQYATEGVPAAWVQLREEARPAFAAMNIWQGDLARLKRR